MMISTISVIGRDLDRKLVLLSGLGFAGRGKAWREDDGTMSRYEGYDTAKIVDASTISDDFGSIDDPTRLWNTHLACTVCNGWGFVILADPTVPMKCEHLRCVACDGAGKRAPN